MHRGQWGICTSPTLAGAHTGGNREFALAQLSRTHTGGNGEFALAQLWVGHTAGHTHRGICTRIHTGGNGRAHLHGEFCDSPALARTHTWGKVHCWESRTTWRRLGRGRAGSWEESETGHKGRPAGLADRLSGTQNHLPAPCRLRPARWTNTCTD